MADPDELLPGEKPTKARWGRIRRLASVAGITLAAGYVLQVGLLYAGQEALLFPGAMSRSGAFEALPPGAEFCRVTAHNGEEVALLFTPALRPDGALDPDAKHRPTLMYFYGNGTTLGTAVPQMETLCRLGANVLLAEYVGYGLSSGRPSEAGCYTTADAAYDYLLSRPGVDPRRLVASGSSLGGAVAIDLAARRPVAGLLTFMTFTRLCDVAQCQFPWVPTAPLLRYRFDSISKIRHVECPVLLVHGDRDLLVPQSMQSKLAAAAGGPVEQLVIPGAGHDNLFNLGEAQIAEAVRRFLAGLKPVPPMPPEQADAA